jgi:N6-adenosine-specific RNA methylase IME4
MERQHWQGSLWSPGIALRHAVARRDLLLARRRGHSAKPEAFYDMVEVVSPGPYVELFARRARFGWDYWGDQSLGTAELGDAA